MHVRPERRDLAVLRRRELERGHEVAAVDRRERVLGALLDPLHRRAEAAGERDGEQLLGVDVELGAEAAADVRGDHAQLRLGHPERGRGEQPQDVRHLRRRPERDVAAGLRPGDDAARLDRVRDQRRLDVAVLHDHVGAVVERARSRASRRRRRSCRGSSWTSVAPSCAAASTSTIDVERLVVDLDELGRVDRVRARVGDHDRDAVALVVDLVDGEREVLGALHVLGHRPGARHRRLPVVAQVGAGEDRDDALGAFAAAVSIDVIRACAYGLRTTAITTVPGRSMLSTYVPRPRRSGSSSLRLSGAPMHRGLGGAHDALPAAAATASTMLW